MGECVCGGGGGGGYRERLLVHEEQFYSTEVCAGMGN